MTLRVRSHRSDSGTAQAAPPSDVGGATAERPTAPSEPPPAEEPGPDGPVILGFPAEVEDDDGPAGPGPDQVAVRLLVVRRADPVAGTAFVLAAVAASVALWVPWTSDGATGATLVRQGMEVPGIDELVGGDHWPPVAVIGSGAVLLLIGMLLFRRARTHRVAGVLALFAAAPAAAGVLVLAEGVDWDAERLGAGSWCAAAVAVLGILGALKAMLTLPRVTGAEADG